jgi:hypothetical protein
MGGGRKKKQGGTHAALLDWSETVDAREDEFRQQVKSTVKRQLSRRQRRTAAAAWADTGSPGAEPGAPADGGNMAGSDCEGEEKGDSGKVGAGVCGSPRPSHYLC